MHRRVFWDILNAGFSPEWLSTCLTTGTRFCLRHGTRLSVSNGITRAAGEAVRTYHFLLAG